jgi:hypothetical protein
VSGGIPASPSTPLVDLSDEKDVDSSKRERVDTADKGMSLPVDGIPLHSEEGVCLFPNVWSKPECYGPNTVLYPSDQELRVIQDLGAAGRSRAMIEGIIVAMKALQVAAVLNSTSIEGEVKVDLLRKERDDLQSKVSQMEEDAVKSKKDLDSRIAALEKQVDAQSSLEREVEAKTKLAEEDKSLEDF